MRDFEPKSRASVEQARRRLKERIRVDRERADLLAKVRTGLRSRSKAEVRRGLRSQGVPAEAIERVTSEAWSSEWESEWNTLRNPMKLLSAIPGRGVSFIVGRIFIYFAGGLIGGSVGDLVGSVVGGSVVGLFVGSFITGSGDTVHIYRTRLEILAKETFAGALTGTLSFLVHSFV